MPRSYYRRRYSYRRSPRARMMAMQVYQAPQTSMRKMTYDCDKFISPGYNVQKVPNVHNIFRANAVWDPDYSLGGVSAIGYASAAEGFNHYTVIASRIVCFWTPYSQSSGSYVIGSANEGAGIPIWAGVGIVPDQTAPTMDYTYYMKDHNWSWDSLVLQPGWLGASIQKPAAYRQVKWFHANKFFNSASPKDDSRLGAVMGANPTEQAYFSVACIAQRACLFLPTNTDFGSWNVHVHIDYWVELQEAKHQGVAP